MGMNIALFLPDDLQSAKKNITFHIRKILFFNYLVIYIVQKSILEGNLEQESILY